MSLRVMRILSSQRLTVEAAGLLLDHSKNLVVVRGIETADYLGKVSTVDVRYKLRWRATVKVSRSCLHKCAGSPAEPGAILVKVISKCPPAGK